MTKHRYTCVSAVLIVVVGTLATACSSATPAVQAPPTTVTPTTVTPITVTPITVTPTFASTVVPTQVSDFPNGVYRTQLAADGPLKDPGSAGIWTLTAKSGTYRLDCRPIAAPGVDCGNHLVSSGSLTVEVGYLRGAAPTVWFVDDPARLIKITGCVRYSQASDGCGPEGGYHLNWKKVPSGIVFSDMVGLGDEGVWPALNNWTVQPWTRIS